MRRLALLIIFILAIYGNFGCAESNSTVSYEIGDAVSTLNYWTMNLEDYHSYLTDDGQAIDEIAINMLNMSLSALLHDAVADDNTYDVVNDNSATANIGGSVEYTTGFMPLMDYDLSICSELYYRDNYCYVINSIFDSEEILLSEMHFEIGQREETVCILIRDYDAVKNTTGRYLLKLTTDLSESSVLYTKTIGKTTDVVLNIDSWQQGQDIEWGDELLYPAEYLFR